MAKKDMLKAHANKNDEFYTQLEDIEKELRHYRAFFEGKTVFCNCDDPFESNFFKYFAMNFNFLKLKKLICTCYAGSPISHTELNDLPLFKKNEKMPYMIQINEVTDQNGDGAVDMSDIEALLRNDNNLLTILDGDGDFRSEECVAWLKESDIVVTNPPFSLFREYVAQLMKYKKKFILLSNQNALTYREFFPLIKNNNVWVGYGFNMSLVFKTPYKNTLDSNRKFVKAKGYDPDYYIKTPAICWFTNLDIQKRHEELILYKKYSPESYPKYINYDAINVDKVNDIPCDYYGDMGVPITFLDKYSPDQFDIIGLGISNSGLEIGVKPYLPEHKKYRKEIQKRGAVDGDLYMMTGDVVTVPYARILIRRKQ